MEPTYDATSSRSPRGSSLSRVGNSVRDAFRRRRPTTGHNTRPTLEPEPTILLERPVTDDRVDEIDDFARTLDDGALTVWRVSVSQLRSIDHIHGRAAGDAVVQEVAMRLAAAATTTRADRTVVRLDHDELAVAIAGVATDVTDAIDAEIVAIADRPVTVGQLELTVVATAGRAQRTTRALPVATTLADAGLALDEARRHSHRTVTAFDSALRLAATRRTELANELRTAIGEDELTLDHLPVIDLATGHMTGAECLLRWNHPDRGVLEPLEFLGIADETGLLAEIGRHTIRTTCRRFATLNRTSPWPLRASINLSAREVLVADLPGTVASALAGSGLDAANLMIEVTEAVVSDDAIVAALDDLRGLGVAIALDDFGTGSSSLSRLADMPISTLKIDPSFVTAVETDPARAAIAGAIVEIGLALGLELVAEGVTTEQQASWFQSRGCHLAQGWLYGRPLGFSRFTKLVTALTDAVPNPTPDPELRPTL